MTEPQREPTVGLYLTLGSDTWHPTLADLGIALDEVRSLMFAEALANVPLNLNYISSIGDVYAQADKMVESLHVETLSRNSPLVMELIGYGMGAVSLGYGVLRLWDKLNNVRLNYSRVQVEIHANRYLLDDMKTVRDYYAHDQGATTGMLESPDKIAEKGARGIGRITSFRVVRDTDNDHPHGDKPRSLH